MTFNHGGGLRVLLHEVSEVLDVAVAFFADARLVEIELDVQFDTHDFRSRFRLGVDDRSRSRFRSRLNGCDLTGAATEVQADTNASHPLSFVGIDVVHAVNARLGEEVLGEVVLHASTHVGEGAAVTTTTIGLADALVRNASGNVRTQTNTRSTEVVSGVKGSQAALDVLVAAIGANRILGGQVVILAIGKTQRNIVGKEVADASTVELAVTLYVTRAIGEVVLAERFHLYGTLSLGQRAKRSGGNHRTDNDA